MPRGRPRKKESALLKSAELIGWALGGLEREIVATRQRLTALSQQAGELRASLGRGAAKAGEALTAALPAAVPTKKRGRRKKRRMSADARKAISEKMKQRWAERKKALAKLVDKRK